MTQTEHEHHEQSISIPVPTPQNVENVIERPNEAIPHVVEHEGRITHLEEQQAAKYAELLQRIEDTKAELLTSVEHARSEQASMLEGRLKALEETALRIESTIVEAPQSVVDDIEQAPTNAIEVVPEVEKVDKPKEPKGGRERRQARHKQNRG